jgi:hypothetical protein
LVARPWRGDSALTQSQRQLKILKVSLENIIYPGEIIFQDFFIFHPNCQIDVVVVRNVAIFYGSGRKVKLGVGKQ